MLCGGTGNATTVDNISETESQNIIKAPFLEVSNMYISKKRVTKNDELKYRFTLSFVDTFDYESDEFTDGPFRYDAYSVYVRWESSKNQRIKKRFRWPGNQKSITIEDVIQIKNGMQSGKWRITGIGIEDYGYNGYSEDGEDSLYIGHTDGEDELNYTSLYTDLSFFSFEVKGVKKKADEKAPTMVKNSLSVSKTKVKKNKKATFSVKIKDESQIKEVACIWLEHTKDDAYDEYLELKYNPKTKKYQCKYKMKDYVQKATLHCIITEDIYGNIKTYSMEDKKHKKKYGKAFSKMTIYRKK